MILLKDILFSVPVQEVFGTTDIAISRVALDSRKVEPGTAFIAIKGVLSDGHLFIAKAIEAGAIAIVCEVFPEELHPQVCYVRVPDASIAAGYMVDSFFGNPSASMEVVGVTGTNGKTTVATLLFQLFSALGYTCGLISTVQNLIGQEKELATHTTPDAVSIQGLLARMQVAGCTHVFMEVSSHAIHQHRIAGIRFAGGVFTNITHDHLDYHKTFEEYLRVKKCFFDDLPESAFALSNLDDRRGAVMLQNTLAKKLTYSLKTMATVKGKIIANTLDGFVLDINDIEVHCRLIGIFNAYNLLAVFGVATMLGQEQHQILKVLSNLSGATGRFESIRSDREKLLGIVDYAHTPDALLNVLATINQVRIDGQQVITVIGCGGDRDKAKRPIMAEVAATHSTKVILTSDNPRSEDPEVILNEMETGLNPTLIRRALRITDRKEAIKTAVSLAHAGDIILIAGKGHETYQEIKGVRQHFDDHEILKEAYKQQQR